MSEVFEGILTNSTDLSRFSSDLAEKGLIIKDFLSESFLLYQKNNRNFLSGFENLAVDVSRNLKKVLLIRYDSRIGYRYSAVYEDGFKTDEFDESDELFVQLDEAGEPVKNGSRFKGSEFDPNEEYETIVNAIQLGLEKIDIEPNRWDELLDLLSQL